MPNARCPRHLDHKLKFRKKRQVSKEKNLPSVYLVKCLVKGWCFRWALKNVQVSKRVKVTWAIKTMNWNLEVKKTQVSKEKPLSNVCIAKCLKNVKSQTLGNFCLALKKLQVFLNVKGSTLESWIDVFLLDFNFQDFQKV